MNKIYDLIGKKDLHTKQYSPKFLVDNLSFDEGRILAYKLLDKAEVKRKGMSNDFI